MKKSKKFLAALIFSGLVLTSCGGGNPGGGDDPGVVEEEYAIRVTAPGGVTYSLSKQKAKKGESVTLTIDSLETGVSIKKVLMNGTVLTSSDSKTYTFTMPNQSALITIEVDVSGDVTLVGEVSAKLVQEASGIYVARNVKVPLGSKKMAPFSYRLGANTILESSELDEEKCFADVTFYYGKEYSLEVARGFTYDFYYDPSAPLTCYVKRVSVDYFPETEEGLYNLFEGTYRSESTVNYEGLKGYTYKLTDKSDQSNPYRVSETMKMYEGNVMYNEIEDVYDEKSYFQYKHYDKDNKTYEVVDTFPSARGNNEYNRISSRSSFAARYDVAADENYDFKNNNDPGAVSGRGTFPERAILKSLTHGAHYGYYFEREFMYSYRVGFSDASTYSRNISSIKDDNTGVITTTVKSYIVYDSTASTTTIDRHEAITFDLVLTFTSNGTPLSINYEQTSYKLTDWDSAKGEPATSAEGSLVKRIEGSFEYGAPYSGAPTFDKSKYFISSIDNIRFYNASTQKPSTDGKSYLHYQDKVNLAKDGNNDAMANLKEFKYTPATALDEWQFGPVSSSDENIIRRTESDSRHVMTCVGIGDATVKFSNYTKGSPTFDLSINVSATEKFHSIYLYSIWGGYASQGTDTSESATIVAGEVTSFRVAVTPSNAPVIYTATSERPDLLTITNVGEKLTLDASGAKNITSAVTVRVRLDSDWFQDSVSQKYKMFSFTIIPASADPAGTSFGLMNYEDHVKLVFTDEAYEGTASSSFSSPKKGYITDDGYQDDGSTGATLRAEFYYEYKSGQINAKVYSISISSSEWSKKADDYMFDIQYDVVNEKAYVLLAEFEYDGDIEDYYYYFIYGGVDQETGDFSYSQFVAIKD